MRTQKTFRINYLKLGIYALFVLVSLLFILIVLPNSNSSKNGLNPDLTNKPTLSELKTNNPEIRNLEEKLLTSPEDLSILLTLASLYFNDGNFSKSEEMYKKVLLINGSNKEGLLGYAGYLRFRGKYEESEELFLKVLDNYPNDDGLLVDIGKLYRNTGEHEKALEMFQKAVKINPTNSFTYSYGLAYLYRDMGNIQKAIESAKKAYELDPNNNFNLMTLGDIYRDAGNYEESEAWFKKALANNPKSESYLGLGFLYLQQERYDEAEKTFQGYLTNIKPKGEIYVGLGYVALARKDYQEAEFNFTKANELNQTVGGYGGLSQVYKLLGQDEKAEQMMKKEKELNPQYKTN